MKIHRLILVCLAPLAAACTCTGQVGGVDAVDASSPVDSGAGQPGLDAGPQLPRCGAVTTAPAPPSALLATSVTSYEVSLAWQPSPDPSTRRYRVLRGAAEIAIVTATTFTHRPAVPGETWVYRVTALSSDAESAPSNEVSVTFLPRLPTPLTLCSPGTGTRYPTRTSAGRQSPSPRLTTRGSGKAKASRASSTTGRAAPSTPNAIGSTSREEGTTATLATRSMGSTCER